MVVAFIIGELAALVGMDGKVAVIIYLSSIFLTVAGSYGLVFVGKALKTEHKVIVGVCFLAIFFGYVSYMSQENIYEKYDEIQYCSDGMSLRVTGKVVKIQEKKYGYVLELSTDDGIVILQMEDLELHYADKDDRVIHDIRHGATITAVGMVNPMKTSNNPGNYDERNYLHSCGVILKLKVPADGCIVAGDVDEYSYIEENLYQIKLKAIEQLRRMCTEKEMGILSAIVLGEKMYMDEDVKELYSDQGIAHALSVSGLHVSVIGMSIYALMRKKMRYLSSATISSVIMILFGLLTGNSVSTVRAVIMFIMHMIADVLGRKFDILSAISLSALALLLSNPFYVVNASFILSFVAMIAVAVTAPIVIDFFKAKGGVAKTLLFSMSLTITSMPINSCLFYRLSTYSIFLNLLVVPLMGIVLAMTIVSIVVSAFLESIGMACIGSAVYILRLYEKMSRLTESLPFSSVVTGNVETENVIVYYGLFILMLWLMWRYRQKSGNVCTNGRNKNAVSTNCANMNMMNGLILKRNTYVMIVAVLVAVMICIVYSPKNTEFELFFLEVGQGDGAYIHSATGNDYLIDCGSTDEKNVGKHKLESFLEYRDVDDIEYIFISHCDTDHISGIVELIERGNIPIENIVLPETERVSASENGMKLVAMAVSHGIEVKYFGCESSFKDGELELWCVSPDVKSCYEDINEASMVLFMMYKNLQVFFAGDIGAETEKILLEDISSLMERTDKNSEREVITIYKVAHHGSKYSSCKELLELLQPDIAVISYGEDNRYGHPHEETLERLRKVESVILTTQGSGAIKISVDGGIVVQAWRESD